MDPGLLGSQATTSLMIVFFLNWLKKIKAVPWVRYDTERINHWLAVVLSGLATLGITISFDVKEHELSIGGLQWTTIAPGIWHWLQTYVMSKTVYHVLQPQINGKADGKGTGS